MVHEFVLGKDPFCSQFSLYRGTVNQEWVGSVSDPLQAGWSHDEDAKVITVNHHIDPETGEFSVTAMLLGDALSGIGGLSLAVRSRVTTGADGFCKESVTYSQVPVAVGDIPPELKTVKFYHMDAVEWTFSPTIDGDYLHFAGKTVEPGMVHEFVLGNDPFCSQFGLYRGTVNQEWVGSVSDPLQAGWSHDEDAKAITVNHHIDPETGEFSVTAMLPGDALSGIGGLSLAVRSRVTTGADGFCKESVTYSQVPVTAGSIPPELKTVKFYHMDAVEWTFPPTIDGDYLHFAGKIRNGGEIHDFVMGKDPFCSQFSLYRGDYQPGMGSKRKRPAARWLET